VFRVLAVVTGLVVALSSHAQLLSAQATATGHWEGAIQVPGQELQVAIDLKGDGKKWEGTIGIPAQGLKGFPLSDISVQGDAVSFVMRNVPGGPAFKGTLSKDGKTISGDFSQGGGTVPFSVSRTGEAKFEELPKSTPIDANLEGTWEGSLEIQGKVLRLAFKLARQADGTGGGTLISIDQGGAEIPVAAVIQSGAKVTLLTPTIVGRFEGELKGDQLGGTWTQGPGSLPLILTRKK
jgi:hypothetical protein